MINENSNLLSNEEKELLSPIVNSKIFVNIWGIHIRCTYCKNYIMGICTAGAINENDRCLLFNMNDYLDAPAICKLCSHSTMKYPCEDKDMKVLVPYCMLDKYNPVKINVTSSACNKFESCLHVKSEGDKR